MSPVVLRPATEDDRAWVARHLERSWGSTIIVSRGTAHDASGLPALVATQGDEIVGLATYRPAGVDCELVSLDALRRGQRIGSELLTGVAEEARRLGCHRLG